MSLRTVALDVLAVGVLLSLLSIFLFVLLAGVISLMTVARARRQSRRNASHIGQIPGLRGRDLAEMRDLAEIDEALDRIMNEECGALARSLPR
jgi:hypothetical protein